MHHVAEVDHADDFVGIRSGAQQVVGVTVAVYDLRAQCRQARQHVTRGARVEVRAQRFRIVRDPGLDARIQQQRALDVPGHEMTGVGVKQAAQAAREAGLESGHVLQRGDRHRLALGDRHARNPAQQPHHVTRAVRGRDPLAAVAGFRGDDARHGQVGGIPLQVTQRGHLEIHGTFALTRRGNLQHVARAVRSRHAVVLVALALERRELARDAPKVADQAHEPVEREARGIEIQVNGAEPLLQGDIHSVRLRQGSIAVGDGTDYRRFLTFRLVATES